MKKLIFFRSIIPNLNFQLNFMLNSDIFFVLSSLSSNFPKCYKKKFNIVYCNNNTIYTICTRFTIL